ncbi:MAG: thiol-disulfide oxidoreductase DCC family protein [Planctomycetaceae bacterium]
MSVGHLEDVASSGTSAPIVFFDGVCGLCNSSVDFVLRRDRQGRLRFAPLQGATAARLLPAADRENLGSLVLWEDGNAYRRSTAVVRILRHLGGLWAVAAGCLWVIPAPIRNGGYRLVAGSRYSLFGKKDACRLPTPEERSRFLD